MIDYMCIMLFNNFRSDDFFLPSFFISSNSDMSTTRLSWFFPQRSAEEKKIGYFLHDKVLTIFLNIPILVGFFQHHKTLIILLNITVTVDFFSQIKE